MTSTMFNSGFDDPSFLNRSKEFQSRLTTKTSILLGLQNEQQLENSRRLPLKNTGVNFKRLVPLLLLVVDGDESDNLPRQHGVHHRNYVSVTQRQSVFRS